MTYGSCRNKASLRRQWQTIDFNLIPKDRTSSVRFKHFTDEKSTDNIQRIHRTKLVFVILTCSSLRLNRVLLIVSSKLYFIFVCFVLFVFPKMPTRAHLWRCHLSIKPSPILSCITPLLWRSQFSNALSCMLMNTWSVVLLELFKLG